MLRFALAIAFCVSASAAYAQSGCEDEKGLKSADSDKATKVTFQNQSDVTIKVYWLDYDGSSQGDHRELSPSFDGAFLTRHNFQRFARAACGNYFRKLQNEARCFGLVGYIREVIPSGKFSGAYHCNC